MTRPTAHSTPNSTALSRTRFAANSPPPQQYIAIAVYFDGADLPQLAKHFYAQAVEERNHAMMLVQYLLDRDVDVEIPGVDAVCNRFDTPRDALALALDQERAVTEQIIRLASVAREEGDYLGEQFMQWFLKEQVEEVATMTTLVRIADRAGTNLFHLEDFVAREISVARRRSDRTQGRRRRRPVTSRVSGPGQTVLQPVLGAAGMVGGHPRHPDVAAVLHVLVMVDGPAVQRAALRRGPVDQLRDVRAAWRSTGPPPWRRRWSRRCRRGSATSRRAARSAASARPGGSAIPRRPRTTSPPRGTDRPTPVRRCRSGAAAPAPCSRPARRSGPGAWSR